MPIAKKIYNPSQTVGQLYAKVYGSPGPLRPVGNVLSLELTHEEDVQNQPDMTQTGGGNYASTRRVSRVSLAAEFADWNPVNFTRNVFGTLAVTEAGTVTNEAHVGYRGGLLRLAHPAPNTVVLKKSSTTIGAAGNYVVRKEGLYILEDAVGITDADALTVDYAHPEHVNIEAITSTAPELVLAFGGMNEADSGNPVIVDLWRVSMGIAGTLGLIQSALSTMPVAAEVLKDPTKTGAGLSAFYRVQLA